MMLLDYIRTLPAYTKLINVHKTGEGNLLELTDTSTVEAQISFFIWALSKARVLSVLEIGTNKGLFGLLLSILRPNVDLTTIDINPDSILAADILNSEVDLSYVYFFCGDSTKILPNIHDVYDFAWVDGNHNYEYALSDLRHCARLSIPYIAIDDTNMKSVAQAVETFLAEGVYKEIENPFISRDSRKARLFTFV